MTNFKKILQETHKDFPLRIKTVAVVTDKMYSSLEKFLKKYRLAEISKIKKTILQHNPLDFGDLDNAEVYIIDIVLGVPVSSYILQQELTVLWSLPEKQIVVRNPYEAMEQLTLQINQSQEIDQNARDKKLSPAARLSTNPHYNEYETPVPQELLAGQTYVNNFTDYLAKIQATRNELTHPSKSGLFAWVKDVKGDGEDAYDVDFNKDIPDAPKVKPGSKASKDLDKESDEEAARQDIISRWGNLWATKTQSKPYTDFVKDLEVALSTPALEKVRKKYKKK
jgi:hypothetical protein